MTIYADCNATTPVAKEVLNGMLPFFSEVFANPSATHKAASKPKQAVAKARRQVANLIGAKPSEIIFTSGGTESDNMALGGAVPYMANNPSDTILVSAVEHPAILEQIPNLKQRGYQVKIIPVQPDGSINLKSYSQMLQEYNVLLVSVMWANNETGVIYPIEQLAKLAHDAGALLHTDAVQAVGKVVVEVSNVDLLSLSSHKIYGPKGIGALYVKQGLRLNPISWGGGQEAGIRSGTLNVAGIVGLGIASQMAGDNLEKNNKYILQLRALIETQLTSAFPTALVNGASQERLPNTINIAFKNLESEMLLMFLDKAGIYVSAGSACSSADHKASHVLSAMKLPKQWLYGVLRISLSYFNTQEDINHIVETIIASVKKLSR